MVFDAQTTQDLQAVFDRLATDGRIDAAALLPILQKFQPSATLLRAQELIASVDADGSGDITFDECAHCHTTLTNALELRRHTAQACFESCCFGCAGLCRSWRARRGI